MRIILWTFVVLSLNLLTTPAFAMTAGTLLGALVGGTLGAVAERFRDVPVSSLAPDAEQVAPADEGGR